MNAHERLRAAIQALLDDGQGWQLTHYVVAMGIERMNSEGKIESAAWLAAPDSQAEWITDGLIAAADEMRASADIVDDD